MNKIVPLTFLIGTLLGFTVVYFVFPGSNSTIDHDHEIIEIELDDFGPSPNFTLTSIDNEEITFSDYTGKVRLVTFFYTACTLGCSPIAWRLLNMAHTLNDRGHKEDIDIFSIDFDYLHDDLTKLEDYAGLISGNDIPSNDHFLWGNNVDMIKAINDWKFDITLDSSPKSGDSSDQIVWTHPFRVYVIDRNDTIVALFSGLNWVTDEALEIIEFLI